MSHYKNESVYVAWQSPDSRDWHVIGNLQNKGACYSFNYTRGVENLGKFTPFSGMEDLYKTYISEDLFPLFKNRLLSPRRPEYPYFIQWLGLNNESATPLEILGRSGGHRTTDQLQMFKRIEVNDDGSFEHVFFCHGLSYLSPSALERATSSLKIGEELKMCLDVQNSYDPNAVVIRGSNPAEIIGYCPRYLAEDILNMLKDNPRSVQLSVANLSEEAPSNYKVMCKLTGNLSLQVSCNLMNRKEYLHIS
ncbi:MULTISPECIES: HIRAN domain-containing protein [Enterobacter cloacae complex]|uniref:HIRAN domain-containing protein n=1 Tax=Enterobacter cloacae complex TaxID=354276 RepID=UPI001C3B975D|nr:MULTISPECIES: HIRAN domain-containing protein [Enterobacter cloacae complex]MCK6889801.1 HIRAN domain-containing protein [Enterobacter kobei]MCK6971698.1 HIRAN domain-containing protein [Enterobacter cloacae]HBH6930753.1 HIRAN domain-containing protein [Enterobacter cloacae]